MHRKPPISAASVEHLLGRARSGDPEALEELFQRCRPMLARWSKQRLAGSQPGGDRPSDIVQEAAIRAFSKFATFNGTTEGEWNTWLRSILNNSATQSFRDAGREKRDTTGQLPLDSARAMAAPALQTSASQTVAFKESWHQLLAEMHRLPEGQRTAIRLCHLEELAVAEAAHQMGKTEDAVAGLLQRGLATLRDNMSAPSSTLEDIVEQLRALRPTSSTS
jgi:RNA polymerase sigma-70 factor, ECF subfamily